jgi:hypothetical protein
MCLERGSLSVLDPPLETCFKIFETIAMRNEMCDYPKEIILVPANSHNLRWRYFHFHGIRVFPRRLSGGVRRKPWDNILMQTREWPVPVSLVTHGPGEALLYHLYRDVHGVLQRTEQIHTPVLGSCESVCCPSRPCTQ